MRNKRFLSMIAAGVIALTALPVTAFAATPSKFITNVHVSASFDDAGNQDGRRPDGIFVHLVKDGKETGDGITLNQSNGFSYDWKNLEQKDKNGNTIRYSVKEDDVDEYSSNIINNVSESVTEPDIDPLLASSDSSDWIRKVHSFADKNGHKKLKTLTKKEDILKELNTLRENSRNLIDTRTEDFGITNKHIPKTISISGKVEWKNDDASTRPRTFSVTLLADGEKSKGVSLGGNGKFEFSNLPKYKPGQVKQEVEYTVSENPIDGYSTGINGTVEEGYIITNLKKDNTTSISVSAAFHDNENHDGLRPEEVKIQLLADGQPTGDPIPLNEKNSWKTIINELPIKINGKDVAYSVQEVNVPGYTASVTGTADNGFVITNEHKDVIINPTGTITWNDGNNVDGKRPSFVKVKFMKNGKEEVKTITAAEGWKYSFPSFNGYENKKPVPYGITIDPIAEYSIKKDGTNFTATYTPGKAEVSGLVRWKGAKKHPKNLLIELVKDKKVIRSTETNASKNWLYAFTDLPLNENGKTVKYSVRVKPVDGFRAVIKDYGITMIKIQKKDKADSSLPSISYTDNHGHSKEHEARAKNRQADKEVHQFVTGAIIILIAAIGITGGYIIYEKNKRQ